MGTDPAADCVLCGRGLPETPVDPDGDGPFCCRGCADVHAALGPRTDDGRDGNPDASVSGRAGPGRLLDDADDGSTGGDGTVRTFLRVDGMHSVTCEAFLESVAGSLDGVDGSEASYVTESMRVAHDPDRITPGELAGALSTLGYEATPRDDGAAPGPVDPEGRDRGVDDMLGFRYAAGVVFGSFVLLPYVVLLYPAQIGTVLGIAPLERLAAGLGGGDRIAALPLFLVTTGVVLVFTGTPLLRGAYVGLKTRRPNTDLLAATTVVGAYAYSTLALVVGRIDVYYDLTVVVAAGVVAAMFYESQVKRRAVDRLTELTVSQVDNARRYRPDGSTETVDVASLSPGDRVLVRRGERVPVDGTLDEGSCTLDEAVVTGESRPVLKRAGDDLVGGSVVTADAAVLRVGDGATSGIDRLTTAVWDLQSADHGEQRRANAVAARVAPVVAVATVTVGAGAVALGAGPVAALLAALAVPLVASPWGLGLATPLSVANAIEEATERGIVVFDETVLERLRETDVVVLDKTGTLTTGEMGVVEADAPDDLLAAAGRLERRAAHPAASAVAAAFADGDGTVGTDGGVVDGADGVEAFRTHAKGVGGTVDGTELLVGHPDLFDERGWSVPGDVERRASEAHAVGRLPVVVGRDGRAEGLVVVGDEPRDGWAETVTRLGERGIDVVVLTGDDRAASERFARHPHVERVLAGVPPAGKVAAIERLRADGHVTMVGDGTNDAAALAAADLGVALGSGTALASEAADLALAADDLGAVQRAFDLAAAARRRLRRNEWLALAYNGVAIPLAAVGLLTPPFAMAAALATGLLVAGNASRDLLAEPVD